MQGGHKPFFYVALSFSPKHYLMCSLFCLVWTLLLCIWKTDGFAWLYVCVSLNLVTCVVYLINEDGSIKAKMYWKETHKHKYLDTFNSNHSLEHKRGVVKILMHRVDPHNKQ